MIVDNLFTENGITFLDDASSAMCIENKQCTELTCALRKQPEMHAFDLFSVPCATFNNIRPTLLKLVNTKVGKKIGLEDKITTIYEGCAYRDRHLGGRPNKDECEKENQVSVGPRPQSLFADKTLKACTDLKSKCFDDIRRPSAKLTCAAQSGIDVELDGADHDDDSDADETFA